jgi:hypothetical protein
MSFGWRIVELSNVLEHRKLWAVHIVWDNVEAVFLFKRKAWARLFCTLLAKSKSVTTNGKEKQV